MKLELTRNDLRYVQRLREDVELVPMAYNHYTDLIVIVLCWKANDEFVVVGYDAGNWFDEYRIHTNSPNAALEFFKSTPVSDYLRAPQD